MFKLKMRLLLFHLLLIANCAFFTGIAQEIESSTFINNFTDKVEEISRQLISGTVPSVVTPAAKCICIPPKGTCESAEQNSPDGTGKIDFRIVTNPQLATPATFACDYGLIPCCQNGGYRCGVRYPPPPNSSSPGPGQAEFGAYPWQAALLTNEEVYLGSGALIDKNHILTVAHKVYNVPIESIKIRLGEWDARSVSEPIPAQDFIIKEIFVHPTFNPNNLFNDVAVLRINGEVNLGKIPTIATVCLSQDTFVGSNCYISGWGKDDFGPQGLYQAIQKVVGVPIKDDKMCQTNLRATRLGPNFIFNDLSFLCAGGENGKDACTGDGGSPLVCELEGRWYAVGLVAWGIGCATKDVPGVYVKVATFISWILDSIAVP